MDKNLCITGVIFFAIGMLAFLQGNLQTAFFMMVMGLGFMAVGLGKDAFEELYETFKSMFEALGETFSL